MKKITTIILILILIISLLSCSAQPLGLIDNEKLSLPITEEIKLITVAQTTKTESTTAASTVTTTTTTTTTTKESTQQSTTTTKETTAKETTKTKATTTITKETTSKETTKTTTKATTETTVPTTKATTKETSKEDNIFLISKTNNVSPGEYVTLEIQGKPNTKYSIKVHYSSGASSAKGLEPKMSNENGYVSWTWKVGTRTKPGDYHIDVFGGGESLWIEFTVTK